jgi:hypothetical protein
MHLGICSLIVDCIYKDIQLPGCYEQKHFTLQKISVLCEVKVKFTLEQATQIQKESSALQWYNCTLSSASALDGGGWSCHTLIIIPQKINPKHIVQEAGWAPRASYTKYFNINHIHVVKGKYSCPCVHHKVIWWSGGIAQIILNLSTRWI